MLAMVHLGAGGEDIDAFESCCSWQPSVFFFKVFCEQVSWVSSGMCHEGGGKGRNALRRRQRAGTSLRKLRGSHQAPRRLRVLGLS